MFDTTTKLYTHQKIAFDKLKDIRVCGLFMDMGTGKTRTAIEFVKYRQHKISNVVWFCPVTLKQTIFKELQKHTILQNIFVFDENVTKNNIPVVFLYVVGIESMSSSARVVFTVNQIVNDNSFCIVDESSFIKGNDSLRTMRITRICERAKYRMILTGTPMTLGIVDLYAQMKFLSPKILGYNSFYSFAHNHLEYSDKYPGMIVRAHNIDYLSRKINPYVYQVKKEECLDLPRKIYKSRYTSVTQEQREWYERAKQEILSEQLREFDSYTLFKLFGALQQIASGFWNKYQIEIPNNRLGMLQNVLSTIPQNDKVIIWCKYTYSFECIINTLTCNSIHGKQSQIERQTQLANFEKSGRILVATMQCGGYGLNLQFAHYAIFYEHSFNYAHRLQAEDRIHRNGQTERPIYIDIYSTLGIENHIANNNSDKGHTINSFKKRFDSVKDDKEALKQFVKEI